MRIALFAFCSLFLAGATTGQDEKPKPDFTATAEEFAKEFNDDPTGFATKYHGKTVEVTGTVRLTVVHKARVILEGAKKKPTDKLSTGVFGNVPAKLDEQLRGLARGQQVTIRGKCVKSQSPVLEGCEFVKVGPSTAPPVTIDALAGEFKKDLVAARKDYTNKQVVVRVEVRSIKTEFNKLSWTVTDPGAKDGSKLIARCPAFLDMLDKPFYAGLEKVKVGDVLLLIADVYSTPVPVELDNVVILKEPPPGVKLPGDKK